MRITGVQLTSNNTNVFQFGLDEASHKDKYLAQQIIGLDADDIVRKFYGFGLNTNQPQYELIVPSRELVFRVRLNPNYSINETFSDIRDELYRSIASNRFGTIDIHFTAGGISVAKLEGYVTKFEVPYSSKVPELQMTIKCDDGMLRAPSYVELTPTDLGTTKDILITDSISTAPHGFSCRVVMTGTKSDFRLWNASSDVEWSLHVTPDDDFVSGDVVYFSNELGRMTFIRIRTGVTTHLLDKIQPQSVWPVIFPGTNTFHFEDKGGFDWSWIQYYPLFWGI